MLRRSTVRRWGEAPKTYPFAKPFNRTPYDEDRHRLARRSPYGNEKQTAPKWMSQGADGFGSGVGLHRAHPLSNLVGKGIFCG